MFKAKRIWVLVADGSRARLFRRANHAAPLELVSAEQHEESRTLSRDLGSDAPGRPMNSGNSHHSFSPEMDLQTRAKLTFGKHLGGLIGAGCDKNEFEELVLVAPPHTLGILRDAIGENARKRITKEVAHDLTTVPTADLLARLEA